MKLAQLLIHRSNNAGNEAEAMPIETEETQLASPRRFSEVARRRHEL